MICDNCKIDKQEKDFINNQKFCYQCEYKLKIKKIAETRKEDTHMPHMRKALCPH